tara:strand:- start:3294 stop:3869 length:576 start_codon:yes stop_codon:yes gene_type:complete
MTKILAFAGSARKDSFNKKLAVIGADKARSFGAEVTLIDLADYPMPIYNGDLEETDGMPENALELHGMMMQHDALMLACPEYNGSITPLLKNTIDWISRPTEDAGPVAAFKGKIAGLMSASPGALGGMRGLVHVRAILSGIGVLVVPGDVSVGNAYDVFDEDGSLKDDKLEARLSNSVKSLVETASRLGSD